MAPDAFSKECTKLAGWHHSLTWATLYETVTGQQKLGGIWTYHPASSKRSHGKWWYRILGPPFGEFSPTFQQAFDAHLVAGVRPDVIVPLRPVMPKSYDNEPPGFHTDRYLVVWRDDRFDPPPGPWATWSCAYGREHQKFSNVRVAKRIVGYEPIRVGVTKTYIVGSPKPAHFAGVFAWGGDDTPLRREQGITYPPGDGPAVGLKPTSVKTVDEFSKWMMSVLQAYGIRCGSLAIVKNRKLVFARAYKWADKFYRDPQPTDMYRIGSVAKWLTGIATMVARDRKLLKLGSNVRSLLGNAFRRLDGKLPAAQQYDVLKVDHLLRHVSGFEVDVQDTQRGIDFFNRHLEIRKYYAAAGKPLTWPAQPQEILRYVASLDSDAFVGQTRMPGDFYAYGPVDTQLLMHLCTRVSGYDPPDLEAQLATMNSLLFAPLGITRFSRILGKTQVRDVGYEVQAHLAKPEVALSDYTQDRPWLPGQYVSNWDQGPAAGGWLVSAVDLARILAALDPLSDDLLTLEAQGKMMWATPPPGQRPLNDLMGNTRRHCFYWGQWPSPGGGIMGDVVGHNGGVSGGQALTFLRRDGLAMALLFNGDFMIGTDHNGNPAGDLDKGVVPSLGADHAYELNAIANAVAFPDKDHFPDFGLPPVKQRSFTIKP